MHAWLAGHGAADSVSMAVTCMPHVVSMGGSQLASLLMSNGKVLHGMYAIRSIRYRPVYIAMGFGRCMWKNPLSSIRIKTHGSESRGQEEAGLRDEPVSYLQVAPL